jgi:hypothetical protein
MRYPIFWAVLLALLLAAAPSRAGPPAGIIMALSGETDPKLAAMQEIPADVSLTLTPGSRLTFLHYGRCRLVTVSAGTVTLSGADYRTDGKIESEKDGPCPLVYTLGGGIKPTPHWPVNPEFVFGGQRAGAVTAAKIFADGKLDKPLMELALAGWRASEPADAPRMAAEGRYVLRLTMRDATQSVDVPFVAVAAPDPAPLVVVRVEE